MKPANAWEREKAVSEVGGNVGMHGTGSTTRITSLMRTELALYTSNVHRTTFLVQDIAFVLHPIHCSIGGRFSHDRTDVLTKVLLETASGPSSFAAIRLRRMHVTVIDTLTITVFIHSLDESML